jgi:hypothetical protein
LILWYQKQRSGAAAGSVFDTIVFSMPTGAGGICCFFPLTSFVSYNRPQEGHRAPSFKRQSYKQILLHGVCTSRNCCAVPGGKFHNAILKDQSKESCGSHQPQDNHNTEV